jgi:hypothetical protein
LGHFGVESCCQRIQQMGFWWPRMRQDIKKEQHSCLKCTRFDVVAEGFHPSKSIMADKPWDHLEIDLVGQLPSSVRGNCWILTIVDVCTAYTVLRPLKSKEMEVVAKSLWEVFCDYGTPMILQSDNGTEFVNKVMNSMTTLYGIEPRLSAAYNPRTNGLVERKNKDIGLVLKKFMEGAFGGWDDWLPMVQISLNQAIGKRTGSAAFGLMFNREFNGLSDFSEALVVEDLDEVMAKHKESWTLFRDAVLPGLKTRVAQVKQEQREKMDLRKQVKPLLPGDIVWIVDVTAGSKWDSVYEGPFTVLKQHRSGTYSLLDAMGDLVPKRIPISQIRTPSPLTDKVDTRVSEGGDQVSDIGKEEHFVVEKVLDHNKVGGTFEYLVKWKGYGTGSNTWEAVENFDGMERIQQYWRQQAKGAKEKKAKEAKATKEIEVKKRKEVSEKQTRLARKTDIPTISTLKCLEGRYVGRSIPR